MQKTLLCISLLTLSISKLSAQYNQGTRYSGMANASAAMFDVWSVNANPAGIVKQNTPTAALNYAKHTFGNDLAEQNLAIVVPVGNMFTGVAINNYGFSEFNEIKASAVAAKRFGDQLSIGVKANYHQIKINNYGQTNAFSIDFGANYSVSNQINVGMYVSNPSAQAYKTTNLAAKIPAVFNLGATYRPSNTVILATTVSKDTQNKFDVATGVDYALEEFLSLRGGMSAKPFRQYVGVGLRYQKLNIDFATTNHPELGYTPQLGLQYAF